MSEQRFFFDLVSDTAIVRDEEGVAVVDLAEAKRQAEATISEVREQGELDFLESSWSLCIRDEDGDTLVTIWINQIS